MTTAAEFAEPPRWLRLSPQVARPLAYTIAALGGVALVAGFRVYASGGDQAWILPMLVFIVVGTVILHRWPLHPIGWLFLWLGAIAGVTASISALVLTDVLAIGDIPITAAEVPPRLAVISLASEALNTATIVALVPLTLLLFPDGRLPSRRWRWVPRTALVAAAIGAVAAALNGGWGGDPQQAVVVSPYAGTPLANAATAVLYPLLMGTWVASAISMVLRYRRAAGIQRTQLKLLAAAAIYAAVAVVGTLAVAGGRADDSYAWPVAFAMGAPPLAAGFAILRYRMFDIDLVIRRSLIVAGLVAFVTGLYVAIVVGIGRLLGTRGETDSLLAVAATAVVAVAFQPVRERLTRLANRLVYGQRSTPYDVLTAFAREVGGTADPDALLRRAAASLADGTGALEATVWLRVGDRLRPAAHHPEGERALDEVNVDDDELPAIAGDLAVPVRHHGQLLGAVTLTKPRGEPPTPTDQALAQRLGDQVGVALTNLRLTAELRRRADELAASRRRVLTAADDERRLLEQRLSERAGQRLVGLQTGLALANRLAADAPRTQEQLVAVTGAVRDAVEELRRLTRGLYPALLETEGLPAALRAAADRSPMDVTVDANGLERLPATHETAIYFCVLEALANAAKHADTPSVRVTLHRTPAAVTFTVVDAGRGFDPDTTPSGAGLQNLQDRLGALDGTLVVRSSPGAGTTVVGTVPVPEGAHR